MNNLIEKAKRIKCLISDVDGVLTNGAMTLNDDGKEVKVFHVQDGLGLKLLMAVDITIAVITTSDCKAIDVRMKQLGVQHYFKGCVNKNQAFKTLKERLSLSNEELAYVGDDLPDLEMIKAVGLGVAVNNAVPAVKEFAAFITERSGGTGAVREVCDLILNAQGKADMALKRYLGE